MTAPELKPDEPDWLAPPLALPPLVRDGTSRLAGCVPVSDIEWRLAEVLLEDEAVFQSGQRWGRNPRIEAVSFLSRPLPPGGSGGLEVPSSNLGAPTLESRAFGLSLASGDRRGSRTFRAERAAIRRGAEATRRPPKRRSDTATRFRR